MSAVTSTPPALKADYQFQDTLASSVASAPDLAHIGANAFVPSAIDGTTRTVLRFAEGNGVALTPVTDVIPQDTYTLVVLFRFDEVDGWRRIVDFKNAASEEGLYSINGDLDFYWEAGGQGAPIDAGKFVQVVLTRDLARNVVGYVDGLRQFTFVDDDDDAVVVQDVLPASLVLDPASVSNAGVYDPAGGTITWDIGVLPAGAAPSTLTFAATIPAGSTAGGRFVNTARIASAEQPVPTLASAVTTLAAPSVTRVSPNKGGNTGTVTVTISGANLDPSAQVKLVKSGLSDVVAQPVTGLANGTRLTATFDLTGQSAGARDLVVSNPSGGAANLTDGFEVVSGGEAKLWVEVAGPASVRAGRPAFFTVRYGNSGLNDAHDLVLRITVPSGVVIKTTLPDWPPDRTDVDFSPYLRGWEIGSGRVLDIWVLRLSSGTTGCLTVRLEDIETSPVFEAIVDSITQGLQSTGVWTANQSLRDRVRGATTSFVQKVWQTLTAPGVPTCTILVGIPAIICAVCGGPIGWVLPAAIIAGAIDAALTAHSVATRYVGYVKEAFDQIDGALAGAIDPNDKFGPSGYDPPGTAASQERRFISSDVTAGYMVTFENLETATAPAQDVQITDQLNSNLDWSTFSFDAIQVGNHIVTAPQGSQSFSTQIDLAPDMPAIVQVNCTFDPATGLAAWLFRGTDRTTGDLADFLPPNTAAVDPQGRGWVSYSVSLKLGLATGTEVRNKATIDFEVGVPPAPIDTPECSTRSTRARRRAA